MTPQMQNRLDQLVGAHLDGALDAERTRELAELLAADGDARKAFARALAMDTALPQVARRRRAPLLLLWACSAAAALLALGVAWWLLREAPGPRVDGDGAVVMRAGREIPAADAGPLRAADSLHAAGAPAVVLWPEGTRAVLAAGGRLDLIAAGPAKDLHLDEGSLDVDAAPQVGDRSLLLRAEGLSASVVGTRFRLARNAGATTLSVQHGSVAVQAGSERRTVAAGQLAVASTAVPLWISPPGQDMSAALAEPSLRLDADAFTRERGAGWTGTVRDGALIAKAEGTAERIANPNRDAGYTALLPDVVVDIDVTLAKPSTVAVFLISRRPDGRDWIGNYALKADLPAGRTRRSFTATDLTVEKGRPVAEAFGGRVGGIAVCAWPAGAGLRLHRLDLVHAAAATPKN